MTDFPPERWSFALRVGFRFAFVYIVLYVFPWPLDLLPGLNKIAGPTTWLWIKLTQFVGSRLLRLPHDLSEIPTNGTGDSTFSYVQTLCSLLLSLLLTVGWTWLGRSRQEYRREHALLVTYLRYFLAGQMFSYGMVKVIKDQFSDIGLDRLVQPFGDASPMGLLWTFMGYSTAYTFFAGVMELFGGLLLLSHRTTLVASLLLVGVMSNVVLLNFCYDVPVKIHSAHFLIFTVVLIAPHLHRLCAFLLETEIPLVRAHPARPLARRSVLALQLLKLVLIALIVIPPTLFAWRDPRHRASQPPYPPRYGIYDVELFVRNGEVLPPCFTETTRWRRVIVNQYGGFSIQLADDSLVRFRLEEDSVKQQITLLPYEGEDPKDVKQRYSLSSSQPSPDVWQIEGMLRGERINAHLHRVKPRSFMLTSRGFHFVNEVYLNR